MPQPQPRVDPIVERSAEREPDPDRGFAPEPKPNTPACVLVDPPAGLVDLSRVIPTAIVIAGYHTSNNFTGAPLPGYDARGAWLEPRAAAALARVADELAGLSIRLIIYDGYRPRSASVAMVAWAEAHDQRWLIDDGWVAPRSEHNRGIAVDLSLADSDGQLLDMGSGWDVFDDRSHTHGVDGPAHARRMLLRKTMIAEGFRPYAREWWHFSYHAARQAPVHDQPYRCRAD